jgi:hypothetical protein
MAWKQCNFQRPIYWSNNNVNQSGFGDACHWPVRASIGGSLGNTDIQLGDSGGSARSRGRIIDDQLASKMKWILCGELPSDKNTRGSVSYVPTSCVCRLSWDTWVSQCNSFWAGNYQVNECRYQSHRAIIPVALHRYNYFNNLYTDSLVLTSFVFYST